MTATAPYSSSSAVVLRAATTGPGLAPPELSAGEDPGGLLAWLVSKLVAAVGLRPIDRMLGAAFGLLRGAIVLLAVAVVVGLTPMRDRAGWQDSQLARVLDDSLHTLRPLLPEAVARHLS